MGMDAEDFWLMPIGLFFDLWACHKQWHGIEKPKKTRTNRRYYTAGYLEGEGMADNLV